MIKEACAVTGIKNDRLENDWTSEMKLIFIVSVKSKEKNKSTNKMVFLYKRCYYDM